MSDSPDGQALHLKTVLAALLSLTVPLDSGTVVVSPEDLVLHYDVAGASSRRIDFSAAGEDDIKQLADASAPATFGRGHEDVLDEAYRKAGKLDKKDFTTNFDPTNTGIMDVVRPRLLEGQPSDIDVRVELYKLNVYGPDSFFKAHVDTPRGEDMFATLVVVLPTPHEGGALRFRHGDKHYDFDTAVALQQAEPNSVAYVAFFCDVEHEVAVVTSGYRVTLTYNLYFKHVLRPVPRRDNPLGAALAQPLSDALLGILKDESFLRDGGVLGFGLRHQYQSDLKRLKPRNVLLKGSDAILRNVCRWTGLKYNLGIVYRSRTSYMEVRTITTEDGREKQEYSWGEKDVYVLCDHVVPPHAMGCHDDCPLWEILRNKRRGKLLTAIDGCEPDVRVLWVIPPEAVDPVEERYLAYGNEASLGYAYCSFVLTVQVPPVKERQQV